MSEHRRTILEAVARGEMSPAEAAERLGDGSPPPREELAPGVRAVRLEGASHEIRITGDPSVHEAIVGAPMTLCREGDVLIVEGIPTDTGSRFWFTRDQPAWPWGIGRADRRPIALRMNPDLALEAELSAGTLSVAGVLGPISAHLSAGSARIEGFASPLDVRVLAGKLRASGKLVSGRSRIACDMGSIWLSLDAGSSVRVRARSEMGKVTLPEDLPGGELPTGGPPGPSGMTIERELVVGDGSADLEIVASMGTVHVKVAR